MMINNKLITDLLSELTISSQSSSRICFHENASAMQIMLIALAPGCKYDYFRNSTEGKIVFVGVTGIISLSTLPNSSTDKNITRHNLSAGDIVVLDKTDFRKTVNPSSSPCVYLECIDGPFLPHDKVFLEA